MLKSLFALLSIPFLLIVLSVLVITIAISSLFDKKQVVEKQDWNNNDDFSYCIAE